VAADLEFRIGAELSEIKGALASLKRDFQSVGASAKQVGAGGGGLFTGMSQSATGMIGKLGAMVGGFVAVQTVLKLIAGADELNSLNARLKLVTSSQEEFNGATQALFEVAQRTRSSLQSTIELYTKIGQSVKDAGVGQGRLLSVVETINKAVQLSGSSSASAEAALTQLGQGLASGTLRGEELNSVLEQTPMLAEAIAKGLKVTRGELRALGQDGKITAQQVIQALADQKDAIDAQFDSLPVTVAQAVTLVQNANLQLLGIFDQASGATGGLAKAIKGLADFLSSDEAAGAIAGFAETARQYFELAGDAVVGFAGVAEAALEIFNNVLAAEFGQSIDEIEAFTGGVVKVPRTVQDMVALVIRAFKELPANIKAFVGIAVVTVASAFDRIKSDAQELKDVLAAIFTDDTIAAAMQRAEQRRKAIQDATRETIDGILAERQAAIEASEAISKAQIRARQKARDYQASDAKGTFKTKQSEDEVRKALALRKAQIEGEAKLEKDSSDRILGVLEDYYRDGLIAAGTYYDARDRLLTDAVNREIETQRRLQAAAKDQAEKTKIGAEIEILERSKTDIARKGELDRFRFSRDLDKQLEQARIQDLENSGQTAEATKARLEAQFKDLLRDLENTGNTAGAELIRKLINTGVAKAQFDEINAEFERLTARLQARQAEIAAQVQTGSLPPDVAQQQSATARAEAIAQLDALNRKMQELAASTNDPAIIAGAQRVAAALRDMGIEGMAGIDRAVVDLRASLANLQQGFAQAATGAGVDALTGLFTDLASGSKSASQAIKDFALNFIRSMVQIAAQALATFLVLQLLEAMFPGAGRLVGATAGINAGVKHGGGMVGQGRVRSGVNPLLFAGAPRYHAGGLVGLKTDERPAILQTGEEVLSRTDPRNQRNGGGSGGRGDTNVRIINAVDPELAGEFFNSPAGEKVFYNLISRNAPQVRNMLGV
jgi:tape measure domain-containing protein